MKGDAFRSGRFRLKLSILISQRFYEGEGAVAVTFVSMLGEDCMAAELL